MRPLTVIAHPTTGLPFESDTIWNDAGEAFRQHPLEFRLLRDETRAIATPGGCTVGENTALLTPGEWVQWNGAVAIVSG